MGGWPRKDDSPQLQKLLQIRDELRQPDVGVQATVGKMDSQVAMGKLMAWTAGENFCTTKAYEYFRTRSNMKIWAKKCLVVIYHTETFIYTLVKCPIQTTHQGLINLLGY